VDGSAPGIPNFVEEAIMFIKVIKAGLSVVVLRKGGAGSGNFGHAGRPGEVGGSGDGGGGGTKLEKVFPSVEMRKNLNREWKKEHGESEGPFWDVEGEVNPRYHLIREKGKLVAAATTVQKGLATNILAIASHSHGAGVTILDDLKSKNMFLVATASSDKSKAWFVKNGFQPVFDRPGEFNVRWTRSNR
jgi:hypothetical protein